jgi:hypothetical protein
VKRRWWQGGQHIGCRRGLQDCTLHGLTLQYQLLQSVDLLLNHTFLLQI